VVLKFKHVGALSASVESLDREHGNANVAYRQMGSPPYPTQGQLAKLRAAAALPIPQERPLDAGSLKIEIPPDGLTLVTIAATPSGAK
jgi:xylan 1,4-beta-xylosidase